MNRLGSRPIVTAVLTGLCVCLGSATAVGLSVRKVVVCATNLRQVGLAITMYMTEHDDKLPDSLDALTPKYLEDAKTLSCPEGGIYTYVGKGLDTSADSGRVIAFDGTAIHADARRYVLFLDAHVKLLTETDLRDLAKKQGFDLAASGKPKETPAPETK